MGEGAAWALPMALGFFCHDLDRPWSSSDPHHHCLSSLDASHLIRNYRPLASDA